LRYKN